jgi:hypothetical protein
MATWNSPIVPDNSGQAMLLCDEVLLMARFIALITEQQ